MNVHLYVFQLKYMYHALHCACGAKVQFKGATGTLEIPRLSSTFGSSIGARNVDM